jgi:sulfate transport system ATP-binding protein
MTIEVRGVHKRFGDFVALDGIDLTVGLGSLTALLGPSGGGKTTLLRVIAGLERADSGTVSIGGVDVAALPPQRRDVGFVFQHYAAFGHLTVARNVAFGLEIRHRPKAEIRRRVDELLALVHLEDFAHRLPSELSGGQRQRMALARAMATNPKVLLLDEPFGALDAAVRAELRTWLRQLHDATKVTTLFVTHDREEAMEVADEIVVVDHGAIQQVGAPGVVYDQPANDFVMSFVGPATLLGDRLLRPHDIEILTARASEAVPCTVEEIRNLGASVRVDARSNSGDLVRSQLPRIEADQLSLRPGQPIWLRPRAVAARTV